MKKNITRTEAERAIYVDFEGHFIGPLRQRNKPTDLATTAR
jgi:hypothetical protein